MKPEDPERFIILGACFVHLFWQIHLTSLKHYTEKVTTHASRKTIEKKSCTALMKECLPREIFVKYSWDIVQAVLMSVAQKIARSTRRRRPEASVANRTNICAPLKSLSKATGAINIKSHYICNTSYRQVIFCPALTCDNFEQHWKSALPAADDHNDLRTSLGVERGYFKCALPVSHWADHSGARVDQKRSRGWGEISGCSHERL